MSQPVSGAKEIEVRFLLRVENCNRSLLLNCVLKGSAKFLPTFTKKSLRALAMLSSVECNIFFYKTFLILLRLLPGLTILLMISYVFLVLDLDSVIFYRRVFQIDEVDL